MFVKLSRFGEKFADVASTEYLANTILFKLWQIVTRTRFFLNAVYVHKRYTDVLDGLTVSVYV